jgi:hypothetical protein
MKKKTAGLEWTAFLHKGARGALPSNPVEISNISKQ